METYIDFLGRINSFEKKETDFGNEYFEGNPSIKNKVNRNNIFKSFYGDTVVFDLDDGTKNRLAGYVDKLYECASECFCERLVNNTFHMTLHDLSNAPILSDVAEELFYNELNVIDKAKFINECEQINMKSKYIFNMVNTSLVLGLYPASEEDYDKLMKLYYLFDDVKKLSYPLTPHITLAYYNVKGFDTKAGRKLERIICELNENEFDIKLNIEKLYYQKFRSMNDYVNVINLGKSGF